MANQTNFNSERYTESPSKVVVVSGPSGVGKGTLIGEAKKSLAQASLSLVLPVSYTTREPREGEVDGEHYHFVDLATFERKFSEGVIFERNKFGDNHYGSPHPNGVIEGLSSKSIPLWDIEVNGAMNFLDLYYGEEGCRADGSPLWIAILPPSDEELEKRLRERGTESEEKIQARLATWQEERTVLTKGSERYSPNLNIVNDDIGVAAIQLVYAIQFGALPKAA